MTVLMAALAAAASMPAHAQESPCNDAEASSARYRYDQAENHKKEGRYNEASEEYMAAFERCPRPFLLFNAGQMLWLDGRTSEALELYQRYLELEPGGSAAVTAHEQFFLAAEEQRLHGDPRAALVLYQRYLDLAPDGGDAAAARDHLSELREREMQRLAEQERLAEETARKSPAAEAMARDAVPRPPAADWRPGTLFVGGTAFLFLGGAMHVFSNHNRVRYDQFCPEGCSEDTLPDDIRDEYSASKNQRQVAIASYVVGGTAFTLGLIWIVTTRSGSAAPPAGAARPLASRLRFTPLAAPDGLGGSLQLDF